MASITASKSSPSKIADPMICFSDPTSSHASITGFSSHSDTTVTVPRARTPFSAESNPACTPEHSKAMSAPASPDSERTFASMSSARGSSTSVAPRVAANRHRCADTSATTMDSTPWA
ncbi:unnamed protein product [Aspergillus oryzae]|nr:unnamed protein product [Aspergillus oryzae]